MIIARNLIPVVGGGILGIVDIHVPKWRFTFFRCRWRRDDEHERIQLVCDCGGFERRSDHDIFQREALAAVRKLAARRVGAD